MKEPYIINISFLKKTAFWAINHTLIKGERQKRDKKKKEMTIFYQHEKT